MWTLEKGNRFLPDVSLHQLKKLYQSEQKVKPKLRLLCGIHRKKGESIDYIADLLSKPRRTVHGWLVRFKERGISAKDSIKQSGRPPQLTIDQRKDLVKRLERGPPNNPSGLWTTKEVKALIKKKYGLIFVNQHVWRLLDNLGFSLQRPRKRHYKSASTEEIKQFKKKQEQNPDTTEKKVLLWAHKMKQHLG
jgi:transposase